MTAEVRSASEMGAESSEAKRRAPATSTNIVNGDGLSECFRVVRTRLYLSLAPCHITNPINGIKAQHLDPLVMTFFAKAGGVVLSYSNIKLSELHQSTDSDGTPITVATVTASSPFTFLWITVDLLIWRPQIGDQLEGYIYMQTASHIGLLVHDTFNASIKMRNIPQDWEFVPSQADEYAEEEADEKPSKFRSYGYWVDANQTKIEGKITFTVRGIHSPGKMLSIEGTLLSPESEVDAQPVSEERRTSSVGVSIGKHKTFDDEPVSLGKHITFEESISETAEIAEPTSDVIPGYEQSTETGTDSDSDESSS